ncbi:hypothetical protein JCGZ_05329 [Jatropha curcas]|uniref:Uncharacterized protein n=1 Tax=Jatropha curcas TaxID=180498 RepID=A0A067L5R7_JATCU|nr:hypothetical protein JCGZ_05329 [Jatropha curcas]
MSQLPEIPEIPSSAYTPEMNTLGAIPDIPTFEGEQVPVSRNPLTSGTRPLQLLPLPGTEFPVRYETSRMRGFQTEVSNFSSNFLLLIRNVNNFIEIFVYMCVDRCATQEGVA